MMDKADLLTKAIKIAEKAHRGQTDRFGAPYIGHVMRVMNYGKTYDEKIVGVLHDVVEDCPEISFEDLLQAGFPNPIVFAIECLTKNPPVQDYNVSGNVQKICVIDNLGYLYKTLNTL